MKYIGFFTPQSTPTGTFNLTSGKGKFVFSNESCSNLKVVFSDGQSRKIPAGIATLVCLDQPGTYISWTTISALNIPCIDACDIDFYESGETLPETYPSSLVRQTVVGNPTSIGGGTVSGLVNDGNNAGTQFIESTVSGDASSAVSVTNDGIIAIGTAAHKGSITLKGTLSTDNASITSDGNGNLTVNELLPTSNIILPNNTSLEAKDSGGTARQILLLSSGNETQLFGVSGNGALTLQSNTNAVWKVLSGSSGVQLLTGTIQLIAGALSRLTIFSGVGNQTINTNVGTTPNTVFGNPCTVSGSSQTIGYTNTQSSTVTVGAGLAWNGTALKN